MSAGTVVVLGSLNRDLVTRVTRLPGAGETVTAPDLQQGAGGKGANQAVAAARAGAGVRMVGAVGDDVAAELVTGPLEAAGVDTDGVRRVTGATTGTALVCVDDHGENTIVVVPGANDVLDADDVDRACAALAAGDVLLCQLEVPLPVVAAAARAARGRGASVVLNAAPAVGRAADLLGDVDVLVVNEHEAVLLADRTDPVAAARALADEHGLTCVVTLGSAGAQVCRPGAEPVVVAAPEVDVADTTGAGDAFVGYLAAGLAAGLDVQAALPDAVAAGALAVTRHGAMAAAPTRHELDQYLDDDRRTRPEHPED
jgi:ribokinase